ncbi:MAG: PEP-CTERM sorting domain-containing protein, partial [Akkermansia sp.]|nr:PEP-CTERM sorting domain-containing protein [Akkermansia sp.]
VNCQVNKITGDTALTYASTARTTAIIGGSGANTLILQTGDKNWSMSKGSTAGNTLEIGNITIDAANTQMITINDAQLSGTIVNNATAEGAGLTLSGNFTLSDSLTQEQVQYTHYYSENGFTENIDIALNIFSGDGNYTFSENMTVEGIAFSDFTRSGSSYTYSSTRIDTIYHVVNAPFTIDGSDTNAAKDATGYHVHAGQTLTVAANQSDSMTAARIMATTTGDGIINLTTTAAVTENTPLVFDGVLKVSAGGDLSVSGANAITAEKLDVAGGKVTATLSTDSDQSVIGHGTEVNIGTGGTLVLAGHDMVGWGKNTAPSIILGSDDATKKAVLDIQDTLSCTFGAPLTMNGNSEVKGTKINNFGSSLTVTNTGNTISISEIQLRSNVAIPSSFAIDVAKGGELTISSKLTNHSDGTININKSGLGKLVVTNSESTWTGTLNVTQGVLELRSAATLNTVVMSSNTSLISGDGTIKSLTLESGAELQADSAVAMADGSSLSLGIGLTLNGDLLDAVKSLTGNKTVDLFTNVGTLTLGTEVFTQGSNVLDATNAIDLGKYFALVTAQTPAFLSDEQLSSGYYLGFDTNGTVYAGLVPEPATATLSLLALAALAARRRRK